MRARPGSDLWKRRQRLDAEREVIKAAKALAGWLDHDFRIPLHETLEKRLLKAVKTLEEREKWISD